MASAAPSIHTTCSKDEKKSFITFREFDTVTEGFCACELEGVESLPFVVRANSTGDSWSSLASIRKQLARESSVKGYLVSGNGETIYMSGQGTISCFDEGTMVHNVVDAESTRSATALLSSEIAFISSESRVDRENWCAYVVSPASLVCGSLHCDPPHGSNWQYLASGQKVWYALNNKTFSLQTFEGSTEAPDMASLSLLHDCYRCIIEAGDFVSVPIHWAHAVNTRLAAIGLSGYSAIPSSLLSPRSLDGTGEDY
jgi:hypothetical protein